MSDEPADEDRALYTELVVRVTPRTGKFYRVEQDFTRPRSTVVSGSEPGDLCLDVDELDLDLADQDAYARRLTQAFFADPVVKVAFESYTSNNEAPLRLRLQLATDAPELHRVRWELLRHPDRGTPLATSEQILFSRYLRSADWGHPFQQRSETDMKALIVIANPTNLASYRPEGTPLQPIDVAGELQRATSALAGFRVVDALVSAGATHVDPRAKLLGPTAVTLPNLVNELRRGYDVLYLVCHGAMRDGTTRLFIENDARQVDAINGRQLADELSQIRRLPILVVLAACDSAGSGANGALSAVGPLLAEVGVPAVVAMQERITVETADAFVTGFFHELSRDGQLDRAAAVARSKVKNHTDYWVPVLFTRLANGCIWPRLTATPDTFEQLPALINDLGNHKCTAVLGPGLIEFLLGSQREVARRWAIKYKFPMSPHDLQDLPQVAQFLSVNQSPDFPASELRDYLLAELIEQYGEQLPADLLEDGRGDSAERLGQLISAIGRQRRNENPSDPYRVLANLPFRVYITANPDDLLEDALREVGREPIVDVCRWKQPNIMFDEEWPAAIKDRLPDFVGPTAEHPFVYHLFGVLSLPQTLVLTEDDYFKYLTGVVENVDMNPACITKVWSSNALLFLGFQLDEWNFRVMFRSIMDQARGSALAPPSYAVQIDPEEGSTVNPRRAKEYLQQYLAAERPKFRVYWASTEEFINALWSEAQRKQVLWRASGPSQIPAAAGPRA
jgi:hypothetical protein